MGEREHAGPGAGRPFQARSGDHAGRSGCDQSPGGPDKCKSRWTRIQGTVFTGTVTEIDLVGTTTQGVVNYAATVSIDNPTDTIRPGMNASANIILQHRENVLLVPNRAVRTVSTRLRTATVLYQGQLIDVPVTLGLSGDSQSEVLSGLQEGDVVLINQTTTTARGVPGGGGSWAGSEDDGCATSDVL